MTHIIDCYAYTSRWRYRHPAEKAFLASALLLLSLILPPPGTLTVLVVITLATILGARVPLKLYIKVLAVPGAFILLGSIALLFSVAINNGSLQFRISWINAITASQVATRAMAAASCLVFFALTTPAGDWLPLLRRLHIPAVVIDTMMITYRLLFIFTDQITTMQQAQAARLGTATARTAIRTYGLIGANLLIRTLDKARRLERGMACRCYNGEIPMLSFEHKPSAIVFICILGLCLAITWASYYL